MRYLMIALILVACGGKEDKKEKDEKIPFQNAVIIDSKNEQIGYVIGLNSGYANIYHAETDLYMQIDLTTGAHKKRPSVNTEIILFASTDCTGDAHLLEWQGEVGKTIVQLLNGKKYLVSDIIESYTYNSIMYWDGGCLATSGTLPNEIGVLVEFNGRSDLENLPFTIEY